MTDLRALIEAGARAAFDAGRDQGSEEATSFEWGSAPMQTADKAFADFMADWNSNSKPLREALAALRAKLEEG
jgi:hypothetical protein